MGNPRQSISFTMGASAAQVFLPAGYLVSATQAYPASGIVHRVNVEFPAAAAPDGVLSVYDLHDGGTQALAIAEHTLGNPHVCRVAPDHGFPVGSRRQVTIAGVAGGSAGALNVAHFATMLDERRFSVPVDTTAGGAAGGTATMDVAGRFIYPGTLTIANGTAIRGGVHQVQGRDATLPAALTADNLKYKVNIGELQQANQVRGLREVDLEIGCPSGMIVTFASAATLTNFLISIEYTPWVTGWRRYLLNKTYSFPDQSTQHLQQIG